MLTDLHIERAAERIAKAREAERKAAARVRAWRRLRMLARLITLAALLRLFWWIGYQSGLVAACFP